MKTKEELNALKEEIETLNRKLAELTEEELKQVAGGEDDPSVCPYCGGTLTPFEWSRGEDTFRCDRCGRIVPRWEPVY